MYRNCQSFSMVMTYQMQLHKRELRNAINYLQLPVLQSESWWTLWTCRGQCQFKREQVKPKSNQTVHTTWKVHLIPHSAESSKINYSVYTQSAQLIFLALFFIFTCSPATELSALISRSKESLKLYFCYFITVTWQ